jgi:hypothetical protein
VSIIDIEVGHSSVIDAAESEKTSLINFNISKALIFFRGKNHTKSKQHCQSSSVESFKMGVNQGNVLALQCN